MIYLMFWKPTKITIKIPYVLYWFKSKMIRFDNRSCHYIWIQPQKSQYRHDVELNSICCHSFPFFSFFFQFVVSFIDNKLNMDMVEIVYEFYNSNPSSACGTELLQHEEVYLSTFVHLTHTNLDSGLIQNKSNEICRIMHIFALIY